MKTIYILKYFNEEDLRNRVQLQLNRGEHRHSLAGWIFFADQGEFRTGDYQEIMNKASCLSLVSNAILVWNTLQIARIVETLPYPSEQPTVDVIARFQRLVSGQPSGRRELGNPIDREVSHVAKGFSTTYDLASFQEWAPESGE